MFNRWASSVTRRDTPRRECEIIDIGGWIYGLFGADGEWGILLCIFLIFLLDALVIPTLPELFFVMGFMAGTEYNNPLIFGAELIGVAVIAEILGILALYYVVEHIRIPHKVEKLVDRYIGFLVMGDERLLLLNRVAPMIPFAGAFISIAGWNIVKSLKYVILGCVLKFGAIMIMSDFFYRYFSGGEAQTVTLIFIFAVITASFVFSVVMKKRKGLADPVKNEKN